MKYVPDEPDIMDQLSSPPSLTSTMSTTSPARPQEQPIYTTAGTIYNPGASQPLQPPSRRGRTLNYGSRLPITPSELAFLPKSLLASLPLKTRRARLEATYPLEPPQYSPLQQNYDRAISPSSNMERQVFERAGPCLAFPNAYSGNLVRAPTSVSLTPESRKVAGMPFDDGTETDDTRSTAFSKLTAKSLANLASYPNPSQLKARRELERARLAHGTLTPTPDAALATSQPQFFSDSSDAPQAGDYSPGIIRPGHSDPAALGQLQTDHRNRAEEYKPSRINISSTHLKTPGYSRGGRIHEESSYSSYASMLALGPGAPRPLKAGPPGQRQYQRSTCDSTIKALKGNAAQLRQEQEEEYATIKAAIAKARAEQLSGAVETAIAQPTQQNLIDKSTESAGTIVHVIGGNGRSEWPVDSFRDREGINETLSTAEAQKYFAVPLPADFGTFTKHSLRLPPNIGLAPNLTPAQVEERNQAIDRIWFEGTRMLGTTTEDTILQSMAGQRPGARDPVEEVILNTKVEQPWLTMEEANAMPASEHASPILDMVFASLLRNVQEIAENPMYYLPANKEAEETSGLQGFAKRQ